jgi:fucose 4-O-acetylase-like acetyltransferase
MKTRNPAIDRMRAIGIILVIAAHCGFPEFFQQLRDFDVVLLMFCSGMSFGLSSHPDEKPGRYIMRRFRRLVLPVWEFLVFFFLFFALCGRTFTLTQMAESFLLLAGGILFVWVYRVFFTSSLCNPFLKKAAEQPFWKVIAGTLILLILNDVLYGQLFSDSGTIGKLLSYLITYTLGYAVVSLLGIAADRWDISERMITAGIFGAIFLGFLVYTRSMDLYAYKYPPLLYYLSYGILWSEVLSCLLAKGKASGITEWLSVHAMDIFLWHIFGYYLMDTFRPSLLEQMWICFLILLGTGILGAFLQDLLKNTWKARKQK